MEDSREYTKTADRILRLAHTAIGMYTLSAFIFGVFFMCMAIFGDKAAMDAMTYAWSLSAWSGLVYVIVYCTPLRGPHGS